MKLRHCLINTLVLAALTMAGVSFGAVLDVPYYKQEKDQWCWNASSQMALKFYGKTYSQTTIAAWAVGGQNVPNYLYGSDSTRKGCDLILAHFGNISATGLAYAMTLSALDSEMANSRPVIIRWGWDSGGGHIVVVRGTSGNSVYLNDPWPANGQSVNSYNWVKRGDGHTWTHTLKLNSSSPVNPYYQYFVSNYNTAQAYLNQYNATGARIYLAYYYYYYGYSGYYYYKYTNNNSNAHYWLNYCLAHAYYYYHYYYNQNNIGYCYAMKYYHYYLAKAYYYGYYYAGNYRAAYAYYYYHRAYEYYYLAYASYYSYASSGNYSAANYYYKKYMQTAASYYNLARQYW